MPYLRRNAEGRIVALLEAAEPGADEYLPGAHPDVLAFIGAASAQGFPGMDANFIRVMEDLIDVLIQKGLLRMTDLPPEAQRKLLARKDMRRKLSGALDLLGNQDVL